ncbi:MAG: phosphate acyltransferase PlsX [Candidatus Hydrothermales bacterium]
MKIVLDLFGTDRAPHPELKGAQLFLEENPNNFLYLVGTKDLKNEVKLSEKVEFVEAEERVFSDEKPSDVLKTKKNSTIAIGLNLLKEGKADVFFSAGNTGAVLAYSIKILGRLKGVKRPAICALFPTEKNFCAVLDVGANADSRPIFLYQFGVMGKIFVEEVMGIENPRVALLSIGEEKTKGNELIIKAKEIFERDKSLNFIGFIEGNEILKGKADVVVTDGFTGNALLKFGEGLVEFTYDFFFSLIKKSIKNIIGFYLMKNVFKSFLKKLSYEELGGAPLLGINGSVFIGHGRSSEIAIKNALKSALKYSELNVGLKIEKSLVEYEDVNLETHKF